MKKTHLNPARGAAAINDAEFDAVRRVLYETSGITLGDTKRDMVYSRLAKRLRHFGLQSFAEYLRLVESNEGGTERQEFINCLTTNKTDFFREPHHFDYLRETLIPQVRARGKRHLRIWSAGCSTGEEPYTLAMTLREECPAAQGWDAKLLASDIDTGVLAGAEKGVYDADRVGDVPQNLLRKYFLCGSGASAGKVAVRPELRELITFRQINFMADSWPVKGKFDAIFCRNVMIYFDRETQRRLLTRFTALLEPDGVIFLGHSESLHWMADAFTAIGNTIYRPRTASGAGGPAPKQPPEPAPQKPTSQKPAPVAKPPKASEPEHNIILGDVKATRGPAVIKTLLGSCVAACLYDPQTGVGGMNHFSLPGVADGGTCARYGAYAMELLVTEIMKKGGDRSRLRAKVFGGAKVLNIAAESMNVGAKNSAFVLQYLEDEGIPIDAKCLGGTRGLLVRFNPNTGKAQAKPLAERDMTGVVRDEEQFGRQLQQKVETPDDDAITLF